MALISCPECGKQISDTTPSCPHCGYVLSTAGSSASTPSPTKIGETEKNTGLGLILELLGILCTFVAVFGLFLFLPLGLLCFIPSFALLSAGWMKLSGMQEVYCPYCGKLGSIQKTAQDYKCPVCKKRSVRDGDYLKPV